MYFVIKYKLLIQFRIYKKFKSMISNKVLWTFNFYLNTFYKHKLKTEKKTMKGRQIYFLCFRAASIVLHEDNCHFLRVDKENFNRIMRDVEANTVRLKEHGKDVLILQRIQSSHSQFK